MLSQTSAVLQFHAVFQFHLMKLFVSYQNILLQLGMYCPVSDPEKNVSPVFGGVGVLSCF